MKTTVPLIKESGFSELLLESMPDGVFTLDTAGSITTWNPSMERISGYSADEAIGKPCTFLKFDSCLGRKCPDGLQECRIFKYGQVKGNECFLEHKAGHRVPVLKSAQLIKGRTGKVRGVVETITDLTELQAARQKAEAAYRRLGEIHRLDKIIGRSHVMQQAFSAIQCAAASDATILIQGESGTGKELAAGAIHYNGIRRSRPFVTVNCSALTETLLESELFGHARGAFTGALRDRAGRFEEADSGTLFLDEIGDISPVIQVKLLRVLQEREVERVGDSRKRKVDIRIIAATNKELYRLVRAGLFREDLYYRLKVFPVNMPPLRDRKEDIPLLISHFISAQRTKTGRSISGISQQAMRVLLDHPWPGNVRELENAIEHAFVLCATANIDTPDLPIEIREQTPASGALPPLPLVAAAKTGRRHLNREALVATLTQSGWNKAETARRFGLSRAAIWKYMKKWSIPNAPPKN